MFSPRDQGRIQRSPSPYSSSNLESEDDLGTDRSSESDEESLSDIEMVDSDNDDRTESRRQKRQQREGSSAATVPDAVERRAITEELTRRFGLAHTSI